MNISSMSIGMEVKHPAYGFGRVKALTEKTAEIIFNEGTKTLVPEVAGLERAGAHAQISGLEIPLGQFVKEIVQTVVSTLKIEAPETDWSRIPLKWHRGTLVLKPSGDDAQVKELPLETFFHKIVMVRNNLRVLEQKINADPDLDDARKVEIQGLITRCYGSLTTFNVLFKEKEDQF
jgi:hypothetical protein